MAEATAPALAVPVDLAAEPGYGAVEWSSPYDIDPTSVPLAEKAALLAEWSDRLLAHPTVDHVTAMVLAVVEDKHFADLSGTVTTQRRVRMHPVVEVFAVDGASGSFESMRSLAPPAGRGWEYVTGAGWDWDGELARLGDLLAEKMAAPTVAAGTYDLVIDPTNLWLTIHESVGHATELDRALGYEAAYAGTSFATFDKLGSLRYGSPVMHVTGDRTTPHGLASVGYDDEGVAAQSFDIVKDGVLVGYQLDRRMAAENDLGRSNGCAFADSPLHVPIQRMANVSLAPAPGAGPTTNELISGVERGIYVVGDKSWSIDMQRYNFQFTGQRFYRIDHGRLSGQLRDVAYQATTTDFWGSHGGGRWCLHLCPRRRLQLREGSTPPGGTGQPRLPLGAVPWHQRPEHPYRDEPVSDGDRLPAASEVIERALSLSRLDDCVVVVSEGSEADVRFANNTTTTNGLRRERRVTVVSFLGRHGGSGDAVAVGVASRGGAVDVAELVSASEADARGAPTADDAMALVQPTTADPAFETPPVLTGERSIDAVVRSLADAFGRARSAGHVLSGFASHRVDTTYLGSSTGLRLRHEQPAGALQLVARSSDGTRSTWAGTGTSWFDDVEIDSLHDRLIRRLAWAERRVELPAGRYEALLPPDATADLMMVLSQALSGRDAEDGRSAFSAPGGGTRLGDTLSSLPFRLRSDPLGARARVRPLRRGHGVGHRRLGLRQRPAHRSHQLGRRRAPRCPRVPPCRGGPIGRGPHPAGRQPRARAPRGRGLPGRPPRPHPPGTAPDLSLVHQGGRPGDPPRHRPDP